MLFSEMKCCIANVNTPIIIFVLYECQANQKWKLDIRKSFFHGNSFAILIRRVEHAARHSRRYESYDTAWNRNFNSHYVFMCHCWWFGLELKIRSRLMHMNSRRFIYLHSIFSKVSSKKKHSLSCVSFERIFLKTRNGLGSVRPTWHDTAAASDDYIPLFTTVHHSDSRSIFIFGFHSASVPPLGFLGSEIFQRLARQGQGIHSILFVQRACVGTILLLHNKFTSSEEFNACMMRMRIAPTPTAHTHTHKQYTIW